MLTNHFTSWELRRGLYGSKENSKESTILSRKAQERKLPKLKTLHWTLQLCSSYWPKWEFCGSISVGLKGADSPVRQVSVSVLLRNQWGCDPGCDPNLTRTVATQHSPMPVSVRRSHWEVTHRKTRHSAGHTACALLMLASIITLIVNIAFLGKVLLCILNKSSRYREDPKSRPNHPPVSHGQKIHSFYSSNIYAAFTMS